MFGWNPVASRRIKRELEIVPLLVDAGSDTPLHLALNYNPPRDILPRPNTTQRNELAKRSVEILLSGGARLSDIGSVSGKTVGSMSIFRAVVFRLDLER